MELERTQCADPTVITIEQALEDMNVDLIGNKDEEWSKMQTTDDFRDGWKTVLQIRPGEKRSYREEARRKGC